MCHPSAGTRPGVHGADHDHHDHHPPTITARNGMGIQCRLVNKDNMGPLLAPGDGGGVSKVGYQGCHEKLNDWAKISSRGACVISSAHMSWHRRCHCMSDLNVDCKAMCAGDSDCLGYVERNHEDDKYAACQWATISNTC